MKKMADLAADVMQVRSELARVDELVREAADEVHAARTQLADVSGAVHAAREELAHLRGSVFEAREELAHLRGSVSEGRRVAAEDAAHLHGAVVEVRKVVDQTNGVVETLGEQTIDNRLGVLRGLLSRVEHYQPTYGLAGLVATPQRESRDRAEQIARALGAVGGLRVLDLGTSLGYFALYLADRGAKSTGWDFKPDNVAIARLISDITGVRAEFHERTIDEATVEAVPTGSFDVVLALSVLHHVIAIEGLESAQRIVAALFERAPVMVVELAAKGEDPDLYWDAAQPEDPLDVFALVRDELDLEVLGSHGTHLSAHERPLVVARRRQVVTVGGRSFPYDEQRQEPYPGAPIGSAKAYRHYYTSADHVVKQYWFDEAQPANWRQIVNELSFFTSVLPLEDVYRAPELVAFDVDATSARLAFRRTPGALLGAAGPLALPEVERVARDVLRTLAELRRAGLFHNDVRSWNIVANDEGGWLIDYGLSGAVGYDDDIAGLLWALHAAATGAREAAVRTAPAPDAAAFTGSDRLLALHAAVAEGERDPARLGALLAE
ncbi:hypothetical protein CHO01_34900 [Cellulomonas hominis]|uniref:O-antigen chain-terminating methyltransferase n=1 Tax=Cellulomonas hominis TaxID=156981 RepID=A0A511FII3_9CELL|nr:methyltransferase domain-containing protein [Cellulomonas hominis]MBB5473982.1 O-antigen chain-terminating methyltransferase [Cellulomonas hominis]GEL48374.1 hypothetical protein CHO01_34900 [Cellulomonas hominis]